jgi:hypothetical protein
MLPAPSKQCAAVNTLLGESMVPVHAPVLPSGMFLRTTTMGDLFKPKQGVPFAIFAVAVESVKSRALHVPVLSESPSLLQEASKAMQRMQKKFENLRMLMNGVC